MKMETKNCKLTLKIVYTAKVIFKTRPNPSPTSTPTQSPTPSQTPTPIIACSIKMVNEYIDWTVPEGGGGPNYSGM